MHHKISFFVINHTSVGGVERVNSRLISLFKKNNLAVFSIISFANKNNKNKTILFDDDLKIDTVSKNKLTKELKAYILNNNITHLIFQGDNMSITKNILNATKNTNCKAFLHYHGSPYAYLRKNLYWSDIKEKPLNLFKIFAENIIYPLKKIKLKKVLTNSKDGFITVSKGVENEINHLFNNTFKYVTSIHNPASFNIKNPININDKEKTIILVSRLVRKHKNVLLALKVWKLLHKKYPEWNLKILGYGVILEQLRSYIKKHNLQNVRIYGYVNNVDEFLAKSAISIVTSDTEGLSMVTYESLGFKIPIVTTQSYGGIYDLVEANYNGLYSPRNDSNLMAKNLEKLITDEKLRIQMGNNSFQKYLELQNEDVFSQWKEVLKL